MPTLATSKFPKPKSEDEFEDLVTDILERVWRTNVERHGRRGQAQFGVDAFAQPSERLGETIGVQYKNVETLTLAQIEKEIGEAEHFRPELAEYVVVTSLDRNGKLQREVAELRAARRSQGLFTVAIWFWQDIESALAGHPDLVEKYFPQWFVSSEIATPAEPELERDPVDWATFYVTVNDEAPRSESYLMLIAEPTRSVGMALDGDVVDRFRGDVQSAFGVAGCEPDRRVRADAVDLVWRSPASSLSRKWRRGHDGSVGFVTTIESAFQPEFTSLWECALDSLLFLRLVALVLPGEGVTVTLDFQPGSHRASPRPLAPADAGKPPVPGLREPLSVVEAWAFKVASDIFTSAEMTEPYDKLAALLVDRWRVAYAQQALRAKELAGFLRALAQREGIASNDEAGSGPWLIGLGPKIVAWGCCASRSAESVVVTIVGYVQGDEQALHRFIADFATGSASSYVLLEELGEGRLLSAPPVWRRSGNACEVTLSLAPSTPRTSAEDIGQDLKLGPDGDLAIEDGDLAMVGGIDGAAQAISVVLGTQVGEWVLGPDCGSRVAEIYGRHESPRLVERLWKLELIRGSSVPTGSGEVQLDFIRRVEDVRLIGYDNLTTRAEVDVHLELEGVGPWSARLFVFVPEPPPARLSAKGPRRQARVPHARLHERLIVVLHSMSDDRGVVSGQLGDLREQVEGVQYVSDIQEALIRLKDEGRLKLFVEGEFFEVTLA